MSVVEAVVGVVAGVVKVVERERNANYPRILKFPRSLYGGALNLAVHCHIWMKTPDYAQKV